MFVKGLEGADEDATVLKDAPHPEVDVLQHLTALSHRLLANQRQKLVRH